jgi:4-hydroxy-2-oxoheptanedioate aldolase
MLAWSCARGRYLPFRLVAREPLYGAWSVIPSPLSVRLLAAAGLDYVVSTCSTAGPLKLTCPDDQRDPARRATPIAQVRHAHNADIGRALDSGCEDVIVPNIDSAAQARQAASAVRHPPDGHRSADGVPAAAEPF